MKHTLSSHKKWILIFLLVAVFCIGAIVLLQKMPGGHTAVIYQDGKELQRIRLDLVTEPYTISLEHNTILVEPGQISMQSATCPDKLCIKQGTLHTTGRIVCLPNHVLIEMVHEKDAPDAKVG